MLLSKDIQFPQKTLDVSPVNGKLEFDSITGHLYFVSGGTRYQLDRQSGGSGVSLGINYCASQFIYNGI